MAGAFAHHFYNVLLDYTEQHDHLSILNIVNNELKRTKYTILNTNISILKYHRNVLDATYNIIVDVDTADIRDCVNSIKNISPDSLECFELIFQPEIYAYIDRRKFLDLCYRFRVFSFFQSIEDVNTKFYVIMVWPFVSLAKQEEINLEYVHIQPVKHLMAERYVFNKNPRLVSANYKELKKRTTPVATETALNFLESKVSKLNPYEQLIAYTEEVTELAKQAEVTAPTVDDIKNASFDIPTITNPYETMDEIRQLIANMSMFYGDITGSPDLTKINFDEILQKVNLITNGSDPKLDIIINDYKDIIKKVKDIIYDLTDTKDDVHYTHIVHLHNICTNNVHFMTRIGQYIDEIKKLYPQSDILDDLNILSNRLTERILSNLTLPPYMRFYLHNIINVPKDKLDKYLLQVKKEPLKLIFEKIQETPQLKLTEHTFEAITNHDTEPSEQVAAAMIIERENKDHIDQNESTLKILNLGDSVQELVVNNTEKQLISGQSSQTEENIKLVSKEIKNVRFEDVPSPASVAEMFESLGKDEMKENDKVLKATLDTLTNVFASDMVPEEREEFLVTQEQKNNALRQIMEVQVPIIERIHDVSQVVLAFEENILKYLEEPALNKQAIPTINPEFNNTLGNKKITISNEVKNNNVEITLENEPESRIQTQPNIETQPTIQAEIPIEKRPQNEFSNALDLVEKANEYKKMINDLQQERIVLATIKSSRPNDYHFDYVDRIPDHVLNSYLPNSILVNLKESYDVFFKMFENNNANILAAYLCEVVIVDILRKYCYTLDYNDYLDFLVAKARYKKISFKPDVSELTEKNTDYWMNLLNLSLNFDFSNTSFVEKLIRVFTESDFNVGSGIDILPEYNMWYLHITKNKFSTKRLYHFFKQRRIKFMLTLLFNQNLDNMLLKEIVMCYSMEIQLNKLLFDRQFQHINLAVNYNNVMTSKYSSTVMCIYNGKLQLKYQLYNQELPEIINGYPRKFVSLNRFNPKASYMYFNVPVNEFISHQFVSLYWQRALLHYQELLVELKLYPIDTKHEKKDWRRVEPFKIDNKIDSYHFSELYDKISELAGAYDILIYGKIFGIEWSNKEFSPDLSNSIGRIFENSNRLNYLRAVHIQKYDFLGPWTVEVDDTVYYELTNTECNTLKNELMIHRTIVSQMNDPQIAKLSNYIFSRLQYQKSIHDIFHVYHMQYVPYTHNNNPLILEFKSSDLLDSDSYYLDNTIASFEKQYYSAIEVIKSWYIYNKPVNLDIAVNEFNYHYASLCNVLAQSLRFINRFNKSPFIEIILNSTHPNAEIINTYPDKVKNISNAQSNIDTVQIPRFKQMILDLCKEYILDLEIKSVIELFDMHLYSCISNIISDLERYVLYYTKDIDRAEYENANFENIYRLYYFRDLRPVFNIERTLYSDTYDANNKDIKYYIKQQSDLILNMKFYNIQPSNFFNISVNKILISSLSNLSLEFERRNNTRKRRLSTGNSSNKTYLADSYNFITDDDDISRIYTILWRDIHIKLLGVAYQCFIIEHDNNNYSDLKYVKRKYEVLYTEINTVQMFKSFLELYTNFHKIYKLHLTVDEIKQEHPEFLDLINHGKYILSLIKPTSDSYIFYEKLLLLNNESNTAVEFLIKYLQNARERFELQDIHNNLDRNFTDSEREILDRIIGSNIDFNKELFDKIWEIYQGVLEEIENINNITEQMESVNINQQESEQNNQE